MAASHTRSVCLSLFLLLVFVLSGALLSFLAIGRNRADSQGLSLRGSGHWSRSGGRPCRCLLAIHTGGNYGIMTGLISNLDAGVPWVYVMRLLPCDVQLEGLDCAALQAGSSQGWVEPGKSTTPC